MFGKQLKTKFLFFSFFLLVLIGRLALMPKLKLKDNQPVRITGRLNEEPQVVSGRQSFRLGQFRITTDRFPGYHYGEELEITGKVKIINYRLSYPEIKVIEQKEPKNSLKGWAIKLGEKVKMVFKQAFPSPYDGLISGIVLGDKSLIPADYWERLKLTGTLHIMVASGMNVALLGGAVLSLLTFLVKRRTAIFIAIPVIYIYSIMTGLTPPITRAVIMVSLIYLGHLLGREGAPARILWLTGLIMVLGNPFLPFDIGFQLSFMATAGLVYLQPHLQESENRLFRSPNFSSTLAVQIFTLPILVVNFGQFNLISPFINLAILWAVPLILMAGMIIGVLGMLWTVLANIASYLAFPLLFYLEQTVNLFAKIKFFQLQLPKIDWWWSAGYYLVLLIWIRKKRHV